MAGIACKEEIRAISKSEIGVAYKRIGKSCSRGAGKVSEGGIGETGEGRARAVSKRRIRKTYKREIGAACERIGKSYSRGAGEVSKGGIGETGEGGARAVSKRETGAAGAGYNRGTRAKVTNSI
ncbi:uncharacterized protein K444DRAFT_635700 [Hyaloscypha bicolor E]|uniref:Uncharacterized protein n=1 Tax=Hyaloscypha bicolor E TaxID=1095630 RepID=A0A2J6SPN1_9HELO|nr:uncharacterized protein K444DRAFT_635700 [Hyaloscypha bicolor E]PMD52748.1 hypothetical protein K444DRAFT_635700 [Hyaloscypha bicolor E]